MTGCDHAICVRQDIPALLGLDPMDLPQFPRLNNVTLARPYRFNRGYKYSLAPGDYYKLLEDDSTIIGLITALFTWNPDTNLSNPLRMPGTDWRRQISKFNEKYSPADWDIKYRTNGYAVITDETTEVKAVQLTVTRNFQSRAGQSQCFVLTPTISDDNTKFDLQVDSLYSRTQFGRKFWEHLRIRPIDNDLFDNLSLRFGESASLESGALVHHMYTNVEIPTDDSAPSDMYTPDTVFILGINMAWLALASSVLMMLTDWNLNHTEMQSEDAEASVARLSSTMYTLMSTYVQPSVAASAVIYTLSQQVGLGDAAMLGMWAMGMYQTLFLTTLFHFSWVLGYSASDVALYVFDLLKAILPSVVSGIRRFMEHLCISLTAVFSNEKRDKHHILHPTVRKSDQRVRGTHIIGRYMKTIFIGITSYALLFQQTPYNCGPFDDKTYYAQAATHWASSPHTYNRVLFDQEWTAAIWGDKAFKFPTAYNNTRDKIHNLGLHSIKGRFAPTFSNTKKEEQEIALGKALMATKTLAIKFKNDKNYANFKSAFESIISLRDTYFTDITPGDEQAFINMIKVWEEFTNDAYIVRPSLTLPITSDQFEEYLETKLYQLGDIAKDDTTIAARRVQEVLDSNSLNTLWYFLKNGNSNKNINVLQNWWVKANDFVFPTMLYYWTFYADESSGIATQELSRTTLSWWFLFNLLFLMAKALAYDVNMAWTFDSRYNSTKELIRENFTVDQSAPRPNGVDYTVSCNGVWLGRTVTPNMTFYTNLDASAPDYWDADIVRYFSR
jgi:hypothetical protein